MRNLTLLAFTLLLLGAAPSTQPVSSTGLVVHEWGTFTTFSGSDGVQLEFNPVADELPEFVMDRAKQAAMDEDRDLTSRGLSQKGIVPSMARMETPVTYFYTDIERLVTVSVDFPQGLFTEFYPPVRKMTPAYDADVRVPLKDSSLGWGQIRLIPVLQASSQGGNVSVPNAAGKNHYEFARLTDSAFVQVCDPTKAKNFVEKFLFYRGIGDFKLPIALTANLDQSFDLTHSFKQPIAAIFLVEVRDGQLRFARFDDVKAQEKLELPADPSTPTALGDALAQSLISSGLYEKEATAMVMTWQDWWFKEEGTRVLYLLPADVTEEIIPLHVDPAPDQTVRVMVGRMEVMTPQTENRIAGLMEQLASSDPAVRKGASDEIRKLGRFAEAALRRVMRDGPSDNAKTAAEGLIAELQRRN